MQLLRRAYDGRIDFYDTGRAYTDGEEKLGAAFSHMRDKVIIASKTTAQTGRQFEADLHTSLRQLKTNYIDIYQFHNPTFCPRPGGADGLYDAALNAQKAGKIRHISITNHRIRVAHEAIDSKLFVCHSSISIQLSLRRRGARTDCKMPKTEHGLSWYEMYGRRVAQ